MRWTGMDWNAVDERIASMQRELSIASRDGNRERLEILTEEFLSSFEARAKAVANVTRNESTDNPGMGESWRTPADRYKATMILDHRGYRTEPFYSFTMFEPKTKKDRTMCIPTFYDRAMHDLFRMLMEPICEPLYDLRLFSSRRGRSLSDAVKEVEYLLSGKGSPEWVARCDVRSFYDTMSHEWLLDNVPMDRNILEQFLKAERYENGKGDPIKCDRGVPTGNRMSPVLANLILNGLEGYLGDPSDPENGIVVRWVDDLVILARTEDDALRFKALVTRFVRERGMTLNENKSYVANVRNGFEFLKYRFVKTGDSIDIKPTDAAVEALLEETGDAMKGRPDEDDIVRKINNHIRGFTNKYRIADMSDCSERIDKEMINIAGTALSKLGNMTNDEVYTRYVRHDDLGPYVQVNSGLKVRRVNGMERVPHERIWQTANPYIDTDYFERRVESEKQGKLANDRFRKIWGSTKGCCGICGLRIRPDELRTIVSDDSGREAYAHNRCMEESMTISGTIVLKRFVDGIDSEEPEDQSDAGDDGSEHSSEPEETMIGSGSCDMATTDHDPEDDGNGPIEDIGSERTTRDTSPKPSQMRLTGDERMSVTIPVKKGVSKFQPLIDIICRVGLQFIDYNFTELDGIITGGLCGSAYKDRDWWMRKGRASIGEALAYIDWKVEYADVDRQKVRLTKRSTEYLDSEEAYRARHKGPDMERNLYERSERMRKSKFGVLTKYLLDCGMDQLELPFDKIGELIGGLPPSAEQRFWWSTRNAGPLMSIEDADFTKVKVDFEKRTVLLTRTICIPDIDRGNVVIGDLKLKDHMKR